jgi:formamidopyrimidine-DNA glycosylase
MPELPEVETIVRQLRPALTGRTLLGAEVRWARTVARPAARRLGSELAGRRITAVRRRGKFWILDLDDGRALVGHLRMTGRLHVGPAPDESHARVIFALDRGERLVFSDVRKFGRLALVERLEQATGALGPEPLDVQGDWLHAALRSRRRRLKPLLLDQAFLAGLGNIYVDESLHRARLHPLRSSASVTAAQAAALAAAIRETLARAIDADGSSFDTFYRTPEGRPGAFQDQFAVYGRGGEACRACGARIRRLVVGQRGTHVCPRCQPAPRGEARRRGG